MIGGSFSRLGHSQYSFPNCAPQCHAPFFVIFKDPEMVLIATSLLAASTTIVLNTYFLSNVH